MKTLAKYLFAVIIGIFVWSLIWPTSASVIADRSFRIGNTISESEKLNPKDTIVGDTTKLKYPIKDFSNNPYQRQNNPFNLKNPSNLEK